jgi:alkanesulfonate monooxygenase SsuD/methylene tetrahydromethanopterin reductase-like flavin-dependent oxidoreductase (luciferase family)
MRIGALLLPNVGWPELARRAAEVEAAGFDAVWVDDHIVHPARPESPWLEAWTTLAGLAGATSRITIGPLVSNIVLRPPALLARQALTVSELSGGRLDLGIGAGYAPSDHSALGEEPWSDGERFRRFEAAVGLVREAAPELPLTVAAHGPRALGVAARFADTWVSYGGFGLDPDAAFELTRRRSERLSELAVGPVQRRLLAGSAALTKELVWRSVDAFDDFVGRYREIGIDELAFHWPPQATNPEVDPAVVDEIVARQARSSASSSRS